MKMKQASTNISCLLKEVFNGNLPKSQWPVCLNPFKFPKVSFIVRDEVVFCCQQQQPEPVVVVTQDILDEVALTIHMNMAHMGRDKLIHLLRQHVCILNCMRLRVTCAYLVHSAN